MTLEQLLGFNYQAAELEKLSDMDLEKILGPKFNVTRPELSTYKEEHSKDKTVRADSQKQMKFKTQEEMDKEKKLAAAKQEVFRKLGIKL